jgi:hypothetical protein
MNKMTSENAYKKGIKYILAPAYNKDIDKIEKINGEIECKLYQYRNLQFHRKLFKICNDLCTEEFFILMLDNWNEIQKAFQIQLVLDKRSIQALRLKFKDDGYTFIYICKWLFLPLESHILPNGNRVSIVASISFREMDNLEFTDFFNQTIELLCFILDITKDQLNINY